MEASTSTKKRPTTEELAVIPAAQLIPPNYEIYDAAISDYLRLSEQRTGILDVRIYDTVVNETDLAKKRQAVFRKMLITQLNPVQIKTEPNKQQSLLLSSEEQKRRKISKSFLRSVRDVLVLKSYDIGKIARQITLMVYEKNCKPGAPVSLEESMQKTKPLIQANSTQWAEFSAHARGIAETRLVGVGSGVSSEDNLLMVCKQVNFASFDPPVLAYELRQMCETYHSEKHASIGLLRINQNVRYLVTQLLVVMNRREALAAIKIVFY